MKRRNIHFGSAVAGDSFFSGRNIDDAAKMIALFATPRLKKLFLAHLSNDCNSPLLAERIMRQALEKASLDKVELQIIAGGEMEKR